MYTERALVNSIYWLKEGVFLHLNYTHTLGAQRSNGYYDLHGYRHHINRHIVMVVWWTALVISFECHSVRGNSVSSNRDLASSCDLWVIYYCVRGLVRHLKWIKRHFCIVCISQSWRLCSRYYSILSSSCCCWLTRCWPSQGCGHWVPGWNGKRCSIFEVP